MKKQSDINSGTPDNSNMWSGILNTGLVGAGVGAAGMGLADALSPEQKKRGLLKSMLMGGALGGAFGAGGRVVSNYAVPGLKNDPNSGVDWLLNPDKHKAPEPQGNLVRGSMNMLASYPPIAGAGVGGATFGAHTFFRRNMFPKDGKPPIMSPDPRTAIEDLNKNLAQHQSDVVTLDHKLNNPPPTATNAELNHIANQHVQAQSRVTATEEAIKKLQNSVVAEEAYASGKLGPIRSAVRNVSPVKSGLTAGALTWLLGHLLKRPMQEQAWYDSVNNPADISRMQLNIPQQQPQQQAH